MEKRSYFNLLMSTLFMLLTTQIFAQAPTTNGKVLVQEPTGARVYNYGDIKTDIQSGAIGAPAAGMVKSNGTVLQTAVVRTDYAEPTTSLATGLLKNTTTTGQHTIAVAGTDYVVPSGNVATATTANNVITNAALTGDVTSNGTTNATTISANAVTTGKIADGAVATADLADAAVTTVKILDGNVTAAKLAAGAVNLAGATVTGIVPIANGGTGSGTQNWIDLTTTQTAAGNKSLTGTTTLTKVITNQTVQAINANITGTTTLGATDNDRTIICSTACTVTLGSWEIGKTLYFDVDKTNAGVITLSQSGETINGLSSPTITSNGAGLRIVLVKKTSATWASSVSLQ